MQGQIKNILYEYHSLCLYRRIHLFTKVLKHFVILYTNLKEWTLAQISSSALDSRWKSCKSSRQREKRLQFIPFRPADEICTKTEESSQRVNAHVRTDKTNKMETKKKYKQWADKRQNKRNEREIYLVQKVLKYAFVWKCLKERTRERERERGQTDRLRELRSQNRRIKLTNTPIVVLP